MEAKQTQSLYCRENKLGRAGLRDKTVWIKYHGSWVKGRVTPGPYSVKLGRLIVPMVMDLFTCPRLCQFNLIGCLPTLYVSKGDL